MVLFMLFYVLFITILCINNHINTKRNKKLGKTIYFSKYYHYSSFPNSGDVQVHMKRRPEALKSLYRSPGYKRNQLVLCKNYVLQW